MYYGIEVVSKPVNQWGIEELREFIGRNGEVLVYAGSLGVGVSFCQDGLKRIGRDFEMVAMKLNEIVNVDGLEEQVEKLQSEVWDLEDADCDNCIELEDKLSTSAEEIEELEDKIAALEEQLAAREE